MVYQRGVLPQAHYLFKHALIQDTAYESVLKTKRYALHTQIAQVLEHQFPETIETQPELVAHHYTEAGLAEQAIPYWQQAGERAAQRFANVEAVGHLTQGIELLQALPNSPQRTQREITLQIALGRAFIVTQGNGAPEVGEVYAQALALSQKIEDLTLGFQALWGLGNFYMTRGELERADELTTQLLVLADRMQDSSSLLEAHYMRGLTLWWLGKFPPALEQVEQGLAAYALQSSRTQPFLYGRDPGVYHTALAAQLLWQLGYPAQAQHRMHQALTLAQEQSQPFTLAYALNVSCVLASLRREEDAVQDWAKTVITLSTDHKFTFWLPWGVMLQGWALVQNGPGEEGIAQIRQGLAAYQATGAQLWQPYFLVLLATAYEKIGCTEEGLITVAEALAMVNKNAERWCEAELYRLKGELLLNDERRTMNDERKTQEVKSPQQAAEAEACFRQAIDITRKQEAKSWELRAVTSLARLWQQRGKTAAARDLLAPVYDWFTEGFDTADLKDAKALLTELPEGV